MNNLMPRYVGYALRQYFAAFSCMRGLAQPIDDESLCCLDALEFMPSGACVKSATGEACAGLTMRAVSLAASAP